MTSAAQRLRGAQSAVEFDVYDDAAWTIVLNSARALSLAVGLSVYREYLTVYPTSVRVIRALIDHALSVDNVDVAAVDAVFESALYRVLSADLWRTYLQYVARVKDADAVSSAYDALYQHMQYDMNVIPLLTGAIAHIKSRSSKTAYDESAKQTAIRKWYQRIVVLPSNGVEDAWREWDTFEHSINAVIAKTLLNELHSRHAAAKSAAKERKKRYKHINYNITPRPPTEIDSVDVAANASTLTFAYQLLLHRHLIAYEMSNPMHNNLSELRMRVVFAYKQALIPLYHSPTLWIEYAHYLAANSARDEDITAVWTAARTAVPYSLALVCAHAEWEEERKHHAEARAIYAAFLKSDPTVTDGVEADTHVIRAGPKVVFGDDTTAEKRETVSDDRLRHRDAAFALSVRRSRTLAHIAHMRFARRESAAAGRQAFIAARKYASLTFHAYVFAADIEFVVNNSVQFAAKIYQSGMDKFAAESEFVSHHLSFLAATNDHANMRVLVERMVKSDEIKAISAVETEEAERIRRSEHKKRRRVDGAANTSSAARDDDDFTPAPTGSLWDFGVLSAAIPLSATAAAAITAGVSSAEFGLRGEPHSAVETLLNTTPRTSQSNALIWHRYIQLERMTSAELAAIGRAEQRRDVALKLNTPRAVTLIDRYRFLDIWPTSKAHRQTLELVHRTDAAAHLSTLIAAAAPSAPSAVATPTLINRAAINAAKSALISPDVNRLVIFHPARYITHSDALQRYGPLPECLADEIVRLSGLPSIVSPPFDVAQLIAAMTIAYPTTEEQWTETPEFANKAEPRSEKRRRTEDDDDENADE